MSTEIDFDQATQHAIPEGKHIVSVDHIDIRNGKESGIPFYNWRFRITDGAHANRCLFTKTSLAPTALWRLQELLSALGLQCDRKINFEPEAILGKQLIVKVKHKEFNNTLQEEIARFKPLD